MSIYDTLLGAPTDQDRMAAIARRLRGQEALGTLATFSGDPIMAPWGQQQMEQIPQRVEQLQRATFPRSLGLPGRHAVGPRIERTVPKEETLAAEERAFKQDLALRQAGIDAALAQKRAWEEEQAQFMPEVDWRQISEPVHQAQTLAELIPAIEKVPDIAQPVADVSAKVAKDIGLGGLVTLLEPYWKSGQARSLRSALEGVLSELRSGQFGAALTNFEIQAFGEYSPSLAGLTDKALIDRAKRYAEFIRGRATTRLGGRRPPRGVDIPDILRPDWQPLWTPETAGQEMASGPSVIPAAVPGGAGATGARVPPARPTGLSDDEWQRYLELEGF